MKTLLTKLQNKRKEEKGFTLVELLVVIAILAILATVSVVGYVGFTQRAKDSNANTELAQAKTLIIAEVLDGKNANYVYEDDILYVLDVTFAVGKDYTSYESELATDFEEIKALEDAGGKFTVTLQANAYNKGGDETIADYAVKSIAYEKDGGTAEPWIFKDAPTPTTPTAPVEGA